MDLKIAVEHFEKVTETSETDSEGRQIIELKNIDMVKFMEGIWPDKHMEEFLSHQDILDMFAHRIGIEGLLRAFNKEEVCDKITWDYFREFFLDHMNASEVLTHIGWEEVSKHFEDDIQSNSSSAEESADTSKSIIED